MFSTVLFVGGPYDGRKIELADDEETVAVDKIPPGASPIAAVREGRSERSYYYRRTVFTNEGAFDLMIPQGSRLIDALKQMVERYGGPTSAEELYPSKTPTRR